MTAPLRIVRTDPQGIAIEVEREPVPTTTTTDQPDAPLVGAQLLQSLRLYRKGQIEGYALALMATGPTPPTRKVYDAWMARYRAKAEARFPEISPEGVEGGV